MQALQRPCSVAGTAGLAFSQAIKHVQRWSHIIVHMRWQVHELMAAGNDTKQQLPRAVS